jgi:hypothetical protein
VANGDRGPDYTSYHRSLTEELYSIKDRIRNLVKHWGTDGEAKEVALRSLLRRHLPESVIVGRGFIVTPSTSSTQIDVLVVDANKPTLFKDGDLLIVTPDAVLGVIEVKTELRTKNEMSDALTKLSKVEEMCRDVTGKDSVWSGLFIFHCEGSLQENLLQAVGESYQQTKRVVNCISCGRSVFIRHWNRGADVNSSERGPVWHSYELPDVAPSYFVGNLIDWISSVDHQTASFAWFPMLGGKEQYRKLFLPLGETSPRSF